MEEMTNVINNKQNTNSIGGSKTNSSSLAELQKMYPTPPSLEHNPDHDVEENGLPLLINIKQEPPDEPRPMQLDPQVFIKEESIKELPAVNQPPTVSMFVGSERYKPLTNSLSQQYPIVTLPMSCTYKPSWQFPMAEKTHVPTPHASHCGPLPVGPPSGPHVPKVGMSPISPAASNVSGTLGDNGPLSQRGPGSVGGPGSAGPSVNYELPSPGSAHSSYLNKTLPSVEPPSAQASQVPEVNSLIVNLALQDSSLNLFKDHNFDSCTMCVCNNSSKVVGNIRGSDGTLYLPPSQLSADEESIVCNCGYSAITNRRLAFQSGLFYEDEVDLTGLHEALINEKKKPSLTMLQDKNSENAERDASILDQIHESMFQLIQSQCIVTLSTPSSVIYRATAVYQNTRQDIMLNLVDFKDGNEIAHLAVDQARSEQQSTSENENHNNIKSLCMHKWCYYQFDGPTCSQDMVRCMKTLQPYLQEAIQKKRSKRLWEPVFNVHGPLTWRQFHRMAVRGTEDMAEPLPIPMLLTGHDRDWLSVAPQSLRHWEKLLLEPYSQQRNIAYVVVSPDNEFILSRVRAFFKELSSIYEVRTYF